MNDLYGNVVQSGMKIWTTVGTSLAIMVISVLLVLAGKIIGQDRKTTPPEEILSILQPEDEKSDTAPGQDAFDIQQDIILKLSQRIAELEANATEQEGAPIDDLPSTDLPREEDIVPSALPLENTPPTLSSDTLPEVADIPLPEFSPEHGAREDFGEALDPYGEWFNTVDYGEVWQPSTASRNENWAPYTNGGWHSTELGWHFTSSDPWGWACYHYGRWMRYHEIGWCWVPGRQWAPSWVSWRTSDHYIGWCPLPPSATWSRRTVIGHWADERFNLGPAHYNFVSINNFGSRNCRPLICDRRTNFSLILATRNITLIAGVQHSSRLDIHNHGPHHDFVAHRQGRRIPRLKIRPEAGGCGILNRVDPGKQHLIAHRVQNSGKRTTALPGLRSLKETTTDSGWDSIRDKAKQTKLRNHIVATSKSGNPSNPSSLLDRAWSSQRGKPEGPHRLTPLKRLKEKEHQALKVAQKPIGKEVKHIKATRSKIPKELHGITPALKVKQGNAQTIAGDVRTQQQKQQELLRKKADDTRKAKALEDARRNAIAQQQQELLRRRADDAKKARAIEDARRNAI
ncbi:MAG: cell envelope integrity protein TolA, partial [Verrucomicrobiaceae bacterium]|nr:cell envelope integrity protein TolA [Verrucomicrobiaceae bacterium]